MLWNMYHYGLELFPSPIWGISSALSTRLCLPLVSEVLPLIRKTLCRVLVNEFLLDFFRGVKRLGNMEGDFLTFLTSIPSFQARGAAPGSHAHPGSFVPAGPRVPSFQTACGSPAFRDSGELALKNPSKIPSCFTFAHINILPSIQHIENPLETQSFACLPRITLTL